jgi:hypothetical protein
VLYAQNGLQGRRFRIPPFLEHIQVMWSENVLPGIGLSCCPHRLIEELTHRFTKAAETLCKNEIALIAERYGLLGN